MKKINPGIKEVVSLFLILFLFGAIAVTVSSVSEVRGPASQAATKTITISANYDGHVNSKDKDSDTKLWVGGTQGSNQRAFIRFPLNTLPSGKVVTDSDIRLRVTKKAGATDNIQGYNLNGQANPMSDSFGTKRIRSGNDSTPYVRNHGFPQSQGLKTIDLGSSADRDIGAAKKAVNRFSIGLRKTVEDGTADHFLEAIESDNTDEPKLIITYTDPPPPPPDEGGSSGNGSTPGGNSTAGTTTSAGTITGAITSINIRMNPISFLVGKLDAVAKIKGTEISKKIKLSSSDSSITISINEQLPQGLNHTLIFSGKKFVNKSVNFKATSASVTVSLGNLIFGDVNNDEKVDTKDLSLFSKYTESVDQRADLNLDQAVNALDYSILLIGLINKGKINKVAGETKLTTFVNTDNAKLGKEFTADILAETGGVEIDGVDIFLRYDPSKLFLKEIRKSSVFSDYPVMEGFGGTIQITALAGKDKPVSGSNVVASLVFEAIEKGITKLEFILAEPFTADNNNAGHLSGSDTLSTADNLVLDIGPEGITITSEKAGVGEGGRSLIFYITFIILSLIIIGGFVRYIKLRKEKAELEKIFVPEKVPLDRLPPSAS